MKIIPITLRAANDFVERWHRHAGRTNNDGGKFAIGLEHEAVLVGVAIVGRPTSRELQKADPFAAELLRLCTSPQCPKGGPSKLYTRAKRIWQLMGGVKFHTYTLKSESGASLFGAGLIAPTHDVKKEQWDRPSRRRDHRSIYVAPKQRWTENLAEVPV